MNENPHIHDLSPIVFSELFEVSIIGTAQDWEDFSYKYPHVFTPGPFTVSPTNQEGEIFTHFQFLSIEYWNIYCYTNIRGEENAIRSDLLLETYNNIALNKKNDKATIRSLIINENKIKNKIKNEIKDEGDFINMEYGKQMLIDEYALDKYSHFTEYIFCSTLYSFFEDILTKFVFELSGNKCFKDNIRSKDQMHGNEKYMSSIKINLKQPNESKYKNR